MVSITWLVGAGVASATNPADALAHPIPDEAGTVQVGIRSRQFEPPSVVLTAGRPTRLVFRNYDSELHAVVPQRLFAGLTVLVAGNGAPEFTEQGFTRVLIPSDGFSELRFTPTQPGTYPYRCDLPGHQMQATIEVRP